MSFTLDRVLGRRIRWYRVHPQLYRGYIGEELVAVLSSGYSRRNWQFGWFVDGPGEDFEANARTLFGAKRIAERRLREVQPTVYVW